VRYRSVLRRVKHANPEGRLQVVALQHIPRSPHGAFPSRMPRWRRPRVLGSVAGPLSPSSCLQQGSATTILRAVAGMRD
jgi:hypothetical protein